MAVYSTIPGSWIADTEAEIPTTGIIPGTIVQALDTGKVFQAINETTWQQLYSSAGGGGGGGVPEAPEDSQTYGRNNAAWVVVGGSGLTHPQVMTRLTVGF